MPERCPACSRRVTRCSTCRTSAVRGSATPPGNSAATWTGESAVMTETPQSAVTGPLAGFTVAVTAARRREELVSLLVRRGARVVEAPAIRIVPTHDDEELLAATRA